MNTSTGEQRKQLIEEIMQQHADGVITLGVAIRRLRLEITGFDQETFAKMCGMSTRALYQLETDKGNPTLGTLDSVLRKFGLRLGLMKAAAPGQTGMASIRHPHLAEPPPNHKASDKASGVVTRGSKPNRATRGKPSTGRGR